MIPSTVSVLLSSKVFYSTSLILDNALPNNEEERREEPPNDGKWSMRQIREIRNQQRPETGWFILAQRQEGRHGFGRT